MPNVNDVGDRATKWIRWIGRIWGTLIVVFTLLMLIGYAWNWVTTGKADPHAVEDYFPIENLPPLFLLLSVLRSDPEGWSAVLLGRMRLGGLL